MIPDRNNKNWTFIIIFHKLTGVKYLNDLGVTPDSVCGTVSDCTGEGEGTTSIIQADYLILSNRED